MVFLELRFLLTVTQPPFPGCSGAAEGGELEGSGTSDAKLGLDAKIGLEAKLHRERSAPIMLTLLATGLVFSEERSRSSS